MVLQVRHFPLPVNNIRIKYLLGASDVSSSQRVQPRATEPIRTFQITLTVDGISQEMNETFSIEFIGFDQNDIFLVPVGATLNINSLEGTIVDQDGEFY